MCDNLNTTYATEAECRFCETREDCAVFRSSFIHRCKYFTIPKRYDQWGYADGFCTDDIDFVSVSLAPWVMIIGWALLMFGIGLLRKERGDYAALRRYGVQVNADVVERTTTESLVKTEPSMPDVKITRYYARASWPIDPAKWGVGNKYCRWAAIRRHVSRYCRRRRGQPAKVSGAACSSSSSASPKPSGQQYCRFLQPPCAVFLRSTRGRSIGYTSLVCAGPVVGVLPKCAASGCGASHEQALG